MNFLAFATPPSIYHIILPAIELPHKIDVLIVSHFFLREDLSNNIPYLFLINHKGVFYSLNKNMTKDTLS